MVVQNVARLRHGRLASCLTAHRERAAFAINFRSRAPFFSTSSTRRDSDDARPPFKRDRPLTYVKPPNPTWKFGHGSEHGHLQLHEEEAETQARKRLDMESFSIKDKLKLLTSTIVPRPLALVSSLSAAGKPNLGLFSYFSLVSHNPPMLSLSLDLPKRDHGTRENIISTREFTVNIVDETFIEAANATAVASPTYVDEWMLTGLTKVPSKLVKPAMVRESPACMECQLYSFQDICALGSSDFTTTVVLASIRYLHIRADLYDEWTSQIDTARLRPLARLAGDSYGRVTEAFDLPHPSDEVIQSRYNGLLG
ncbi:flavoprotein oxygenase [Coprinopsis sp. MPI-PUGE-AT-0042]|nr:flavoprotein oxygenase [Coprinopsis sp. MPI-PUGE-AT-0042]